MSVERRLTGFYMITAFVMKGLTVVLVMKVLTKLSILWFMMNVLIIQPICSF